MLCNLAYIKMLTQFDIKLRLRVSRGHSVRNKSTVLNGYIFPILYTLAAYFYWKWPMRIDELHACKSFNYSISLETCNVHNLLRPCEFIKYHFWGPSRGVLNIRYPCNFLTKYPISHNSWSQISRKLKYRPFFICYFTMVCFVYSFTGIGNVNWKSIVFK